MKIENTELDIRIHYLSSVTYVPSHVNKNAGHPDCEQGVIVSLAERDTVNVLYCKGRTIQQTSTSELVWG